MSRFLMQDTKLADYEKMMMPTLNFKEKKEHKKMINEKPANKSQEVK